MQIRNILGNKIDITEKQKKSISFKEVKDEQHDKTYYIRDGLKYLRNSLYDIYQALWITWSFDHFDYKYAKKIILPAITSGAAFVVGECVTKYIGNYYEQDEQDEEYKLFYKFIIGSAILGYSITNRITDKKPQSQIGLSVEVACEVLALSYLYMSTFYGSRLLLDGRMPEKYNLITSLGFSSLAFPGLVSYASKKIQNQLVKREYHKGAQRSDTALISAGLTPVINTYLQANYFLISEMIIFSRLFQVGLISDNILNASHWVQQFKNLPALVVDVGPSIIKKLISQQEKIKRDYIYNTSKQKVLFFKDNKEHFIEMDRCKLKSGDLVLCDENFDLSSAPVSGEVVCLNQDGLGKFTKILESKKINVNLKAHNGEDVWIEYKTKSTFKNEQKNVDLHSIRDGKQCGVLSGAKLNLYDGHNFFIKIKEENERTLISNYEKKSVINQIIIDYKSMNIIYSIMLSFITASLVERDIASIPIYTVSLLFNLFQIMIPFSETFLRDMVNSRLLNEINKNIQDNPIETIDALRIVDFCNVLSGYYENRFPRGAAIVSDKTGTLTTSIMKVLGVWTSDMGPDVQARLLDNRSYLLPDSKLQNKCLEVFLAAYTNNKKELEPEEFSILNLFNTQSEKNNFLSINVLGNNHFRKTYSTGGTEKIIETWHLGLFKALGGRLTLALENGQHYLIFFGTPNKNVFQDTELFNSYSLMKTREGVLSRDWCLARTEISDDVFEILRTDFDLDKKQDIEKYLVADSDILTRLSHHGTFLIDNPVKKEAEALIEKCQKINIPVFIATGDTSRAAQNIAKILCPNNSKNIISIKSSEFINNVEYKFSHDTTIIFSGVSDATLALLNRLLSEPSSQRPVIIFSEMSTEDKGKLASYLKKLGYFVVANGDGTNDIAMMKEADFVISHLNESGLYAPGVEQFSNLSDKQLQRMMSSEKSIYELFDIHKTRSSFMKLFTPLANTQEKPSMALLLKSCKLSFELAKSLRVSDLKEMKHQHWFSVAFDLIWLWVAFNEITKSIDLPADNKSLDISSFSKNALLITFSIASMQSCLTYFISGESTNSSWMILMLACLPFVLKSLFMGFGETRDRIYSNESKVEISEEKTDGTIVLSTASISRPYS